jgi:hypothetical protein
VEDGAPGPRLASRASPVGFPVVGFEKAGPRPADYMEVVDQRQRRNAADECFDPAETSGTSIDTQANLIYSRFSISLQMLSAVDMENSNELHL